MHRDDERGFDRDGQLLMQLFSREIGTDRANALPAEFRRRITAHPWLKTVGVSAFMCLFFLGYFWALRHPMFPVREMPWTRLDEAIPFQPAALPLYLSLWIFVLLPPALIEKKRELWQFAGAAVGLAIVGLAFFLFWPTRVPAWNYSGPESWAISRLKQIDATGNACPSLHVAYAVFVAFWCTRLLRAMEAPRTFAGIGWIWCAGILYSTMATRQHVAWDVAAGVLLGAIAAVPFRSLSGNQRPSDAIMASG